MITCFRCNNTEITKHTAEIKDYSQTLEIEYGICEECAKVGTADELWKFLTGADPKGGKK